MISIGRPSRKQLIITSNGGMENSRKLMCLHILKLTYRNLSQPIEIFLKR